MAWLNTLNNALQDKHTDVNTKAWLSEMFDSPGQNSVNKTMPNGSGEMRPSEATLKRQRSRLGGSRGSLDFPRDETAESGGGPAPALQRTPSIGQQPNSWGETLNQSTLLSESERWILQEHL